MIEQLSIYLSCIILGIMLFFSFIVAPVTFSSLNEENARIFIRNIFPYYYKVNLIISFIVLLCLIYIGIYNVKFYLILLITILFAFSNFILMPLINKYRDNKEDKKFKYSHFLSVIINFVQMIFLIIILI